MTFYQIIGIVSAVVFMIAYIPYVVAMVKGKTKPHPFSWLLWALIGITSAYFYMQVGAKETLPFAFAGAIFPLIIVFISFRYWKGGFSLFDYCCLALSALAVIAYIIFQNASMSLTMSLCADVLAFLPTIRKTYRDASSENISSWSIFLSSYILSLVATIPRFTYGVVVFPAYLTLFGFIMCGLILRGRLKNA